MPATMIEIGDVLTNNLEKYGIGPKDRIAVYGTGEGAKEVFRALEKLNLESQFKLAIDRDDSEQIGGELFGRSVCRLHEAVRNTDIIIIAARVNHLVISQRTLYFLNGVSENVKVINPFLHKNTIEDEVEYVHYLEESNASLGGEFVPFQYGRYRREERDTKIIAWYLPQFHQMEVNNKFHGQGFTEWTNTSKAFPQFCGHYQPHIPYDVGYYDLLNAETLKRQAYLAHNYGIYGFAFHYYWFSGERIMEKPLNLFLEHKEIDLPFCINWADENWTSVWDGGNQDIMYEQKLNAGDEERFMEDLLPLLMDSRYIKIEGKPLISIYRADIFEKGRFSSFVQNIRNIAKKKGFEDLFILITTATKNEDDPRSWGADGLVEFPPHRINQSACRIQPGGYLNPHFRGNIYDMNEFVGEKKYMVKYNADLVFRTAMTGFDNTARRGTTAAGIFYGLTPEKYKIWLKDIVRESKREHSSLMDFVFVNGWNEWAEGAHLEPDLKYGYAYLEATGQVLEEVRKELGKEK